MPQSDVAAVFFKVNDRQILSWYRSPKPDEQRSSICAGKLTTPTGWYAVFESAGLQSAR